MSKRWMSMFEISINQLYIYIYIYIYAYKYISIVHKYVYIYIYLVVNSDHPRTLARLEERKNIGTLQ